MASSPSYIPYLCVAAAAFITTFLAVPLVKRLAIKLDAVDYPSKRRINTKPIPRLGGTAVFLGLVVACIVQILGTWYLAGHPSWYRTRAFTLAIPCWRSPLPSSLRPALSTTSSSSRPSKSWPDRSSPRLSPAWAA